MLILQKHNLHYYWIFTGGPLVNMLTPTPYRDTILGDGGALNFVQYRAFHHGINCAETREYNFPWHSIRAVSVSWISTCILNIFPLFLHLNQHPFLLIQDQLQKKSILLQCLSATIIDILCDMPHSRNATDTVIIHLKACMAENLS